MGGVSLPALERSTSQKIRYVRFESGLGTRPKKLSKPKHNVWRTTPLTAPALVSPQRPLDWRSSGARVGVCAVHKRSTLWTDGSAHARESCPDRVLSVEI